MSIAEPERESFIAVYGKIPMDTKWRLICASRKAKMKLSDWCVMMLERAALNQGEPDEDEDTKYNR